MAKNPMQRQARNSFLIGIIIGLILTAAVGAILFMQMKKLNEQNAKTVLTGSCVFSNCYHILIN